MTWDIVLGILTLVGGIGGVLKVVSNNTRALTKLECITIQLQQKDTIQDGRIDNVCGIVNDHETRLTVLEEVKT